MLTGLILIILTENEKHAPYIAISLNNSNLIEMNTYLIFYSFFKKKEYCVHIVTKLAFYQQQSFVLFSINNRDFFYSLREKCFLAHSLF